MNYRKEKITIEQFNNVQYGGILYSEKHGYCVKEKSGFCDTLSSCKDSFIRVKEAFNNGDVFLIYNEVGFVATSFNDKAYLEKMHKKEEEITIC